MKPKYSKFIPIIVILIIISTSLGFPQFFSHFINQTNLPLRENTFEEWRSMILNRSNVKPTNFLDFPQETISNFDEQINIYQDWSEGYYSSEEKNNLLFDNMHTPEIRYLGPNNHPIEGYDLISHNDEKFELNFRLDDKILNEWVVRVYTYLDYDIYDTIIGNSEKFEDGSNYKHFQPGEQPSYEDLNPDTNFMGADFDKILEDHNQWTTSERDYSAKKIYPGRIDQELFFHVKVLYKKDIYETNGWHSYYFYSNFYISWYWTSNFQLRTLNIKDDDIGAPVISNLNIIGGPIYDAYNEVSIEINAVDESGISELCIEFLGDLYVDDNFDNYISIPNPSVPGTYILYVTAIDADLDREGDQLSSTISFSLSVFDDDTETPVISNINIIGSPIYDAYSDVSVEINVNDESGISELYIEFLGDSYFDDDYDNYISIPNPTVPGTYTLYITAVDADLDREGDQLSSTKSSDLSILDDDTTAPQIIIDENEFGWNISIFDNDGIIDSKSSGNYSLIDQYGNIIDSGIIYQEEVYHYISKELINLMKPSTVTLRIYATNNDCEWEGDEETSEACRIIVITLEDCFKYVDAQIEELKKFINEHVQSCFKYFFIEKLNLAQENLRYAYSQVIQGNILCGLYHLENALLNVKIIKLMILCFFQMLCCSDFDSEYIICTLNDIINNIILLKGSSVDYGKNTDLGYQIAEIEVEVLKLKDFIQENIDFCDAIYLKNLITRTANKVKAIIFYIAQDYDFSCLITCAQNLLDRAKSRVNHLVAEGSISQTLAETLIEKITQIQIEIDLIR